MTEILIDSKEEKDLRAELAQRTDAEARRMERFLSMPDLSRTEGSPIKDIAQKVVNIPDFKDFYVLKVPEIVPVKESFDLFNFPKDHPTRNPSDTYYMNESNILRTHTTIMWYYQMQLPEMKEKIAKGESLGAFSYGKVYRKDEIDRNHMNVFHQIDGWYLAPKEKERIGIPELKNVLIKIAKAIYGENITHRFNEDTFPFTDPSLEMEIELNGKWVEVLGSGVVHENVLKNLGIDPGVYNGWAFGFGLERLAILSMELPDIRLLWSEDERVKKQLKLGQKFQEVSKYPPIIRDISFIVPKTFVPNNYFDLIRDIGGDLVEEVSLLDKYENDEKFGADKMSYTYRTIYRSTDRTLRDEEVVPLQSRIEEETKKQFGAEIR